MPRILCSFSGGRTSRYMTERMLSERDPSAELLIVFANTGDEDERTLEFVDRCGRDWLERYGARLHWVEAVVSPEAGSGTKHRLVTFETASRAQEPFRDVIAKYGLPNRGFNHCNRELKLRPIHSFVREHGWEKGSYFTAIGIRADEIDRMSPAATKEMWLYPLIRMGVKKEEVLAWSAAQPFDLATMPEEFGNCVTCHKKSLRKLLSVMETRPEAFAWRTEMEAQHAFSGAGEGPRRFYRGGWTTLDLRARLATNKQTPAVDLDEANGCSESCDAFTDAVDPGQADLFGEAP